MWARAADHARKKVWFSICVERRGKGQISALQKMSPPWAFNTAPEAQFAVGLPIPPSRLRRATVPQFNMVASLRAQSALAMFPVSLGLLRPVSRTARGLRAPLFPSGKRRLLGSVASYGSTTIQKAPLGLKGAHEARALCAKQREVSPVRQGASQASPASEARRLCRTVECCRRQPTEGMTFAQEQLLSGAIPQDSACSSSGVPGIEKPPANASKEEYHAYLVRLQEHFAREDAAAAAERARQAAEHVPERRVPEFVRERLKQLRAQAAARRARERAESEARYRKALATWFGDTSAEKAECCA